MAKNNLKHTLASLSIAGLIAGAAGAMPGSSFGSSGCGGASGCGGSEKSGMTGCGGASGNTPPSTIPMDEMKEEMAPPPELPEDQKPTAPEIQPPADTIPAPDSDKK